MAHDVQTFEVGELIEQLRRFPLNKPVTGIGPFRIRCLLECLYPSDMDGSVVISMREMNADERAALRARQSAEAD